MSKVNELKRALEFLDISQEDWQSRGPETRRLIVGPKLRKARAKYHPDNKNRTGDKAKFDALGVFNEDSIWKTAIEGFDSGRDNNEWARNQQLLVERNLRALATVFYRVDYHKHFNISYNSTNELLPGSISSGKNYLDQLWLLENIEEGNLSAITEQLSSNKLDVNFLFQEQRGQSFYHQRTPLLVAIEKDSVDIFSFLKSRGAKLPRYCYESGISELRLALLLDKTNIVSYLLSDEMIDETKKIETEAKIPEEVAKTLDNAVGSGAASREIGTNASILTLPLIAIPVLTGALGLQEALLERKIVDAAEEGRFLVNSKKHQYSKLSFFAVDSILEQTIAEAVYAQQQNKLHSLEYALIPENCTDDDSVLNANITNHDGCVYFYLAKPDDDELQYIVVDNQLKNKVQRGAVSRDDLKGCYDEIRNQAYNVSQSYCIQNHSNLAGSSYLLKNKAQGFTRGMSYIKVSGEKNNDALNAIFMHDIQLRPNIKKKYIHFEQAFLLLTYGAKLTRTCYGNMLKLDEDSHPALEILLKAFKEDVIQLFKRVYTEVPAKRSAISLFSDSIPIETYSDDQIYDFILKGTEISPLLLTAGDFMSTMEPDVENTAKPETSSASKSHALSTITGIRPKKAAILTKQFLEGKINQNQLTLYLFLERNSVSTLGTFKSIINRDTILEQWSRKYYESEFYKSGDEASLSTIPQNLSVDTIQNIDFSSPRMKKIIEGLEISNDWDGNFRKKNVQNLIGDYHRLLAITDGRESIPQVGQKYN